MYRLSSWQGSHHLPLSCLKSADALTFRFTGHVLAGKRLGAGGKGMIVPIKHDFEC